MIIARCDKNSVTDINKLFKRSVFDLKLNLKLCQLCGMCKAKLKRLDALDPFKYGPFGATKIRFTQNKSADFKCLY